MKGYQTHETFWADYQMYCKMFFRACFLGLLLQIAFLAVAIYGMRADLNNIYISGTNIKMPFTIVLKYCTGYSGLRSGVDMPVESQLQPYARNHTKMPVAIYREFVDWLTDDTYKELQEMLMNRFKYSFLVYLLTAIYLVYFINTSRGLEGKKILRGAQLTPLKVLNERLAKEALKNPLSCLQIGDTILPYEMESKHILVLGSAGSGKGVLLNQLVAQITARKKRNQTRERCVFYDLKGEFVSKQYDPQRDYIFSPFDARSLGWNIFNELDLPPDYDVISKSLFLAPDTKDEYWYNCAKDVFRTGLVYLKKNNTTRNIDLWEFFSSSIEVITAAFNTLPIVERGALKHIDKADSPTSATIISILQERIGFFRYLVDIDGDFSFRKFIREQSAHHGGQFISQPNLYILNIEQYETIFKPLMTLAIDTMIRETLSLPDDLNRRIFFIIDELGTLYRMNSILKLETVGRSKGACLICANQDLGRIEDQYGKANLKSFFNNFNTNFTFRIREPETADFLSKAIGEQHLLTTMQSRQMSPNDIGDRKSFSEQEKMERLIIPTEFQEQNDLEAIINIANFGIAHITIPPIFYKERYQNFIMRTFLESYGAENKKDTESENDKKITVQKNPDISKLMI